MLTSRLAEGEDTVSVDRRFGAALRTALGFGKRTSSSTGPFSTGVGFRRSEGQLPWQAGV
jgi:hypothetical protein